MEEFKIRTYGFSELASKYLPNINKKSASFHFNRKIKSDEEFRQKLEAANYRPNMKTLTPKMVSIFVEYFGKPY